MRLPMRDDNRLPEDLEARLTLQKEEQSSPQAEEQPPASLSQQEERPHPDLTSVYPQQDPGHNERDEKPVAPKKSPWAFGAIAAFLLSKGKAALLLLLKFGKPLLTMAVTVGAYALIYPWAFAIGFVMLILVHELGHVVVAKRKGLPVSAPYFIPFLGAMVRLKRNPKDAVTEADIALGGPWLGAAGAFVCFGIGVYTDSGIWHMLAYLGFFLNLLNLLPMQPLDGGRIAAAVSRWFWVAGIVIGPFAIWYTRSMIFTLIWIWFLWTTYRKFTRSKENGSAVHIAEGVYQATADPTLPDWYYKGAQHLRELPYTAYCRLDGVHVVEFWWEAMSFKGELPIEQACTIRKVYAYQVEGPDADNRLTLKVRVEGNIHEPDNYYEVSPRQRWRIGLLYGGLMGLLIYMMWFIEQAGWTHPMQ